MGVFQLVIKRYLYLTGAIFITAFIFSNSALPASESSAMSRGLLSVINSILPFEISHHFIRKLAHFSEFFLQGFFFVQFLRSSRIPFKKSAILTAAVGLLTACCDEFLQNFSEGRAPRISDIFIDFSGTLTALFTIWLIFYFINGKKSTNSK